GLGALGILIREWKKGILNRRVEELFKQENELLILCDIEIGLIRANDRVNNYLTSIKNSNLQKLVMHVDELEKIVHAQEKHIYEIEQKVEQKKMEILFNKFVEARK
ncbi:hypothetical protein H5410_059966, partial [Solanum commersonii]